jgi:hypothetical protein
MMALSGSYIGPANELPVDAQEERKAGINQFVLNLDPEFLIMIIVSIVRGTYKVAPTFPASLATKARIKDGLSWLTSNVSSSSPSQMMATFSCGKSRGID